jgi:3-isopropylmalate dehydrogenase
VLSQLIANNSLIRVRRSPLRRRRLRSERRPLPEATLALAQQAGAVIVGATGVWKYDKLERALRPEQGILGCARS